MTTGPDAPPPHDAEREPTPPPPPPEPSPPPPPAPPPAPPLTPPVAPTAQFQAPVGYGPRPMSREDEKLWAIAAHLGPLVLGFLAPLIVWLAFKERSAFLDRSAKEALNMQLSYLLYGFLAGLSLLILVGIVLVPLVAVSWLVLMILATVKVASFEEYRYPLILRFIS